MGIRNIRFEYYRVYAKIFDVDKQILSKEDVLYNITPLLEKAYKTDVVDRVYQVSGEESRLQEIEKDDVNPNIWKMNFIRMRDIAPGIAKKAGDYNLMVLEEDEYIGEEITAIYDQKYNVIMVQRNRNSLSPTGLAKFFTGILNNGTIIELMPIIMPEELENIENSKIYKKATVSFCPTKIDDEVFNKLSTGWKEIFSGAKELGAINAVIMLSTGNSKKQEKTLNKLEVIKLKNLKNKEAFNKIEIKKKEEIDTEIETIDLIDGKLYDIFNFEYSRINPIEYKRIHPVMKSIYLKRENFLKNIINEV